LYEILKKLPAPNAKFGLQRAKKNIGTTMAANL
jgi:hypothetical protein